MDPTLIPAELEALKAQVQAMHDNERRLMDTVKVVAGLMLGLAAILVLFAWFASHKNYEHDKLAIQKALETTNELRYAAFNRDLDTTLNSRLSAREQSLDRKLAELAQSIRTQMATSGGVSSNSLAQQNEDFNRKILLMVDVIENRNAHPFGLLYFDYAIRAVNVKNFPAASDYFLAASIAFLRSRDDSNLNTSLARLSQLCFPNLKMDDFAMKPLLDEKFAQLVDSLDKANVNGRYTVALVDLRREFVEAKRRTKAK
ncbi:MAG: hypothetical protein HZA92_17585 [Verrucomicrobia bacterium]|nr:hypothetical protein [Verrucomicrobiota bacterium]